MFIIKVVTMITGAILIVLIGEIIKQKHKKKLLKVLNLFSLLKKIKTKMSFNKAYIKDIISNEINDFDDEFKEPFINFLENNNLNIYWFDDNENKTINDFFNSLGENNLELELNKFEIIFQVVNEMRIKYEKISNTNGALAYKLSICGSLMFLIMFA